MDGCFPGAINIVFVRNGFKSPGRIVIFRSHIREFLITMHFKSRPGAVGYEYWRKLKSGDKEKQPYHIQNCHQLAGIPGHACPAMVSKAATPSAT